MEAIATHRMWNYSVIHREHVWGLTPTVFIHWLCSSALILPSKGGMRPPHMTRDVAGHTISVH